MAATVILSIVFNSVIRKLYGCSIQASGQLELQVEEGKDHDTVMVVIIIIR